MKSRLRIERIEKQKHARKSKTLDSKRWRNKRRTKRKGGGNPVCHLHLRLHQHRVPASCRVASAFPSSVGYVARKSKRSFGKRMDRYTHERTTAEEVKMNKRRKSEKHEGRERPNEERTKKTEHAYVRTYVRTRVQPPCVDEDDEDDEKDEERGEERW